MAVSELGNMSIEEAKEKVISKYDVSAKVLASRLECREDKAWLGSLARRKVKEIHTLIKEFEYPCNDHMTVDININLLYFYRFCGHRFRYRLNITGFAGLFHGRFYGLHGDNFIHGFVEPTCHFLLNFEEIREEVISILNRYSCKEEEDETYKRDRDKRGERRTYAA